MTPPTQTELPLILSWRIWASAIYMTVLGIVILLGGPLRFSSASLASPRALMAWWCWGFVFVVLGISMLAAMWVSSDLLRWVLFGGSVPPIVFAMTLALSAQHSPVVAMIGVPTYLFVGTSLILSGIGLRYGDVSTGHSAGRG